MLCLVDFDSSVTIVLYIFCIVFSKFSGFKVNLSNPLLMINIVMGFKLLRWADNIYYMVKSTSLVVERLELISVQFFCGSEKTQYWNFGLFLFCILWWCCVCILENSSVHDIYCTPLYGVIFSCIQLCRVNGVKTNISADRKSCWLKRSDEIAETGSCLQDSNSSSDNYLLQLWWAEKPFRRHRTSNLCANELQQQTTSVPLLFAHTF